MATRRQVLVRLGGFGSAAMLWFKSRAWSTEVGHVQADAQPNAPCTVHWRTLHSTTVLADGRVLVAGGRGEDSAEIYDPSAAIWSVTGSMTTERYFHSATLLADGRVLATGGSNSRTNGGDNSLAAAELYDPATGTWTLTAPMTTTRSRHASARLPNGHILVVGGVGLEPGHDRARMRSSCLRSAEAFDPNTETWTPTPPMQLARSDHASLVLLDGRVLVAAGTPDPDVDTVIWQTVRSTGEVFDPGRRTWVLTAEMTNPYGIYEFVWLGLMPDGRIGGMVFPDNGQHVITYDPISDQWTAVRASGPGFDTAISPPLNPSVSLVGLADGRVLASGGLNLETGGSNADATVFDPATASWTPTGSMTGPRQEHTTVVLRSGKVLAFGGIQRQSNDDPSVHVLTSEVYDPLIGSWSPTGP